MAWKAAASLNYRVTCPEAHQLSPWSSAHFHCRVDTQVQILENKDQEGPHSMATAQYTVQRCCAGSWRWPFRTVLLPPRADKAGDTPGKRKSSGKRRKPCLPQGREGNLVCLESPYRGHPSTRGQPCSTSGYEMLGRCVELGTPWETPPGDRFSHRDSLVGFKLQCLWLKGQVPSSRGAALRMGTREGVRL